MFGPSWRTTVFGMMAAIGGAVVAGITTGMIDVTHLPAWLKGVAGLLSTVGLAGVGLSARDNKVTSEEANAGPQGRSGGGTVGILALLLLTLGLALGTVVLCVGCAGTTANRVAYQTTDGVGKAEEAALRQISNDRIAAARAALGSPTTRTAVMAWVQADATWLKAADLHHKYTEAYTAFCLANATLAGGTNTTQVLDSVSWGDVIGVLAEIKALATGK